MRRREAILSVAAIAAASFGARGQAPARPRRIGFLGLASPVDYAPFLDAFLQGMRELGYEDGRNITIEYRWADGREERLPELAAELVRLKPDLIVAHAIGVGAAQRATSTIPIVMGVNADPVGFGLIKSLAKPGGNTTGVASQSVDLTSKRLELLKEVAPNLRQVAVLSNLALPASHKGVEATEIAARGLGARVRSYGVSVDPAALDAVLATILRERPDGLIVQPDPITGKHGARIARFALEHRLPAIGGARPFVVDGGLMSYGGNFSEGWRLAARYVDKILRGAKPADLPVEQPTVFEFVINANTAKALGVVLPPSLMSRATEVVR